MRRLASLRLSASARRCALSRDVRAARERLRGQAQSDRRASTATRSRQHALFNAGRTLSYALVGTVLGAAGSVLYDVAGLARLGTAVRGAVGVFVGLAIITVGLGYLSRGRAVDVARSLPLVEDLFQRLTASLVARVDRWVDGPAMVALGAMHGCSPVRFATRRSSTRLRPLRVQRRALAFALGLGTFPRCSPTGPPLARSPGHRATLHRARIDFIALALVPPSNGLAAFGIAIPKPPLPMPWT